MSDKWPKAWQTNKIQWWDNGPYTEWVIPAEVIAASAVRTERDQIKTDILLIGAEARRLSTLAKVISDRLDELEKRLSALPS